MHYVFSSLDALADWCANHARQKRDYAAQISKQRAAELRIEATAYENIADLLRNTTIDPAAGAKRTVNLSATERAAIRGAVEPKGGA